jgi:hypothetical protein
MLNYNKTYILQFLTKTDHEINMQVSFGNRKIATAQSLKFLGLTIDTFLTLKCHIGELTSRLNKACYAVRSIKSFRFLGTYFSYVNKIISYGIIFWGNWSHSEEIFKIQKRIIMNSSKNASCWQLFKELYILPIQSQYIFSIPVFVTKIKTNFCLNHKYIKKQIQEKLTIYTCLQQTWQCTKSVFITQELRFTIIYQKPLKIYLVIRINSN